MIKDIEAANLLIYILIGFMVISISGLVYHIISLNADIEDCFVGGAELMDDNDKYIRLITAMISDIRKLIRAGDNLLDNNEYSIDEQVANEWEQIAREVEAKL